MGFPSYLRYEPFVGAVGSNTQNCLSLTRTGSSNSSITSVVTGNIVGYDLVEDIQSILLLELILAKQFIPITTYPI